jgi:hypothetical protein
MNARRLIQICVVVSATSVMLASGPTSTSPGPAKCTLSQRNEGQTSLRLVSALVNTTMDLLFGPSPKAISPDKDRQERPRHTCRS